MNYYTTTYSIQDLIAKDSFLYYNIQYTRSRSNKLKTHSYTTTYTTQDLLI